MFARHELCWPAHYHLICAENVAVGALASRGFQDVAAVYSTGLSERLGLDMSAYGRRTGLDDTCWARDLYDAAVRPIS